MQGGAADDSRAALLLGHLPRHIETGQLAGGIPSTARTPGSDPDPQHRIQVRSMSWQSHSADGKSGIASRSWLRCMTRQVAGSKAIEADSETTDLAPDKTTAG